MKHPIQSVAFSPDGMYVAATDGWGVALWEQSTSYPSVMLEGRVEHALVARFSPDGVS